ncbi:MAG TPA: Rieske 2Fe-2S domain-containing protein [Stellaceae bacterium]|nr:Rieske 2Fe-2S domain-containing protein [Stellaceae bacterium]
MAATPIDYEALTRDARVHGSLYRDPAIFEREFDAIWHKVWVYLAHESEIPRPGDYVSRQIGRQPVIAIRDDDGGVNVFFNRCRHRGNLLCHRDHGNAETLKCPYHGWTYGRSGDLLASTFEEAYGGDLNHKAFGLTRVPRVGTYRGLIFASASAEGATLEDHLGQVKTYIDLFMDVSPSGEIDLRTGVQKLKYKGNWKFLPENSLEGDYHGPFIHKIAFELHSRRSGLDMSSLYENEVPDVIRSLPGGHMIEDYRGASMAAPKRAPSPARQAYVAMMEARYGAEKARELLGTIPPLVYVFPNLIYIMTHIRRLQPVTVDETFVYYQPMLLTGAPPEINEARLREHEFGFGPAGLISPDDIEIMERNQRGVRAEGDDWQFIGRGAHRNVIEADGSSSGFTMDECHLRGMWRHYGRLMSGHG